MTTMDPRSIRATARTLAGERLFTGSTVLLAGLTAGCALAVVALLQGVLFSPLPFEASDRLVSICERHERLGDWCAVATPTVAELGRESRTLAAAGAGRGWTFMLDAGDEPVTVPGGIAGPGFFQALGVEPLLGRLPAVDEMGELAGRVLLLGEGLWTRRFGADPAILGRTVGLDGVPHTIVGVLPDEVEVPDIPRAELWRPLHFGPEDLDRRDWRGFVGVARLADGVDRAAAESELRGLYARLDEEFVEIDASWRLDVIPLLDRVVGGVRAELWMFAGAVLLFVLIGGANVLNLFFFRTLRRRDQERIRHALGAPAVDRFARWTLEGATVGALAAVVAAASGAMLLELLLHRAPPDIPRLGEVGFGPTSMLVGTLTALLVCVLASLASGQATRPGGAPTAIPAGRTSVGPWVRRVRATLVATEAALAFLLVASGAILLRSFQDYGRWDPGYELDGLAVTQLFASTAEMPDRASVIDGWRRAEEHARAIPGVQTVATVSAGPLFGGEETDVYRADAALGDDALPSLRWYDASPGYFEALGRTLVAGRDVQPSDELGADLVAVVNETLAQQAFPGEDPLGRSLELPERDLSFRVVGVVADVPRLVPGEPIQPEIFWSNRQLPRWGSFLVVRLEPGASVPAVEEALTALEPTVSVGSLRPLEERFEAALVRPRFLVFLIVVFAAMATLLAAGGLFAVLSVSVAEHVRELGIRMALGAPRHRIVLRTLGAGLGVAGLGVVVGAGLHLALETWLVAFLPGLRPAGPALLVASVALLLGAATLSAVPPAFRAGRADPLELLRDEA